MDDYKATRTEIVQKERELNTAELAAKAAAWSAAISGLTLFITAIGILYVRDTLVETRKATKAAGEGIVLSARSIQQTSHQFNVENRPWVSIENIQAQVWRDGQDEIAFVLSYELMNYGNMPAQAIDYSIVYADKNDLEGQNPNFFASLALKQPSVGSLLFPGQRRTEEGLGSKDGYTGAYRSLNRKNGQDHIIIGVKLAVQYRDSEGGQHITAKEFLICKAGSNGNAGTLVYLNIPKMLEKPTDAAVIERPEGNLAS